MADETDGMGESFDDTLRIILTIAAQAGERLARLHEQQARQREAASVQANREYAARFDADRAAARASLAPVQDPAWWDTATVEDIGRMHQTATGWREYDDVARDSADLIREQVQERYGVDIDTLSSDTLSSDIRAENPIEHDHDQAAVDREKAAESTSGQTMMSDASRREYQDYLRVSVEQAGSEQGSPTEEALYGEFDPADLQSPPPAIIVRETSGYNPFAAPNFGIRTFAEMEWDSAERRDRFAADLDRQGVDPDTVAARILADGETATHPREAVAATTRRGRGLRKPAATQGAQRDRGGLGR